MSAHGPDVSTYVKATSTEEPLVPVKLRPDGLAFMFETSLMLSISKWALSQEAGLQKNYNSCWENMPKRFKKQEIIDLI